jgi:hypothetical protein
MHRIALLLTMAVIAHHAHADTTICQGIDGHTTCTHATGNVRCTSINGETRCTAVEPQQSVTPPDLPDITLPGIDIHHDHGRLRVRSGNTEVEVPQYP